MVKKYEKMRKKCEKIQKRAKKTKKCAFLRFFAPVSPPRRHEDTKKN